MILEHVLYALAWASFGYVHSRFARQDKKEQYLPLFGPAYRFAYNLIAIVHFALVVAVGFFLFGNPSNFGLPLWVELVQVTMIVIGIVLLGFALRQYDLGLFLGTSQIQHTREGRNPDEWEPLVTTGLNRYVRHPIYLATLLVFWGAVRDEHTLAFAFWGTVYTLIGMHFEERGLEARYGESYRAYKRQTPALIPLPWRRVRS